MTATERSGSLHSMGDDHLVTIDPAADIRDRNVVDKAGEAIGHVDDLLVDDREHRVRFLRVAAGGFLGLGEAKFLIPVDAITRVEATAIYVDQTRDHVTRGPRYDPSLMDEPALNNVYSHYSHSPYWAPGYTYPTYPSYSSAFPGLVV